MEKQICFFLDGLFIKFYSESGELTNREKRQRGHQRRRKAAGERRSPVLLEHQI
jgi:hypothetical protein